MEKLTRISKRLDTFFKVMQRIICIGMTVAVLVVAILSVVNMINPQAVIGSDFNTVDIGPVTIELAQELAPDNGEILKYVWVVVVLGGVMAAFFHYALGVIRKILKPMTEGRPFDFSVGRNIKKIAYMSLVLGVVQNVGSLIETAVAVKTFRLTELPNVESIRSVTANYTFDFNFLILFLVLILMAHIFNYGTELQNLSDETL